MQPDLARDLAEVMTRFRAGAHDPAVGAAQPTLQALAQAARVIDMLRTSGRRWRAVPLQVAVALAIDGCWDLRPQPRARRDLAACETCGAARGARCVTAGGDPTKRPHLGRGVPA